MSVPRSNLIGKYTSDLNISIKKFDCSKKTRNTIASHFFHGFVRMKASGDRRKGLSLAMEYESKLPSGDLEATKLLDGYLNDPGNYLVRYRSNNPPDLNFNTLNKGYNARITRNNLKNVEYALQNLCLAYALENSGSNCLSVLDIGVGRSVENIIETLGSIGVPYNAMAIDRDRISLRDFEAKYGDRMRFVEANVADPDFKLKERVDFASILSVLYINPIVLRPIILKNFVDCIKPGGFGVLTSLLRDWHTYSSCVITTNTENALEGWSEISPRLDGLRELMLWSYLNEKTKVFRAPSIEEISESFEKLGCEIIGEVSWPACDNFPCKFYGGVIIRN